MSKETSKEIASIAGKILGGQAYTEEEAQRVAASALAQYEDGINVSLRNYFAIQILKGLLSGKSNREDEFLIDYSYKMADEMIKAGRE